MLNNKLTIGTKLYHPCSVDIIEYKVIGINKYTNEKGLYTEYISQSVRPVGSCGLIKVRLTIDMSNSIRFVGLVEDYEYADGLQDFVEGIYYTDEDDAKLDFYKIQELLIASKVDRARKEYEEAIYCQERLQKILKKIKNKRRNK